MKPLALVFATAVALTGAAAAHASSGRRPVDLPAGRLADAAIALGQQTGISIGIADPAIANRRVRAVKGRMAPAEALQRMLEGTAAAAVPIDGASWRIVRRMQPPAPPAPAPLRAAAEEEVALPTAPIADLVVTASKRNISVPAFPGTATVVAGSVFEANGAAGGSDALAAQVPTVTSTHIGPGRNKLFIRGIADSSFTGPTQATSGQYFGDTRLNYNAPDPDLRLYDVSSVEVLEGPQGTLYGAGSLGGIIRIVGNAPQLELFQGSASAGVSTTAHGAESIDGSAMLNIPLVYDQLGARFVGYAASDGGYIDDLQRGIDNVNRTRTYGARGALRAQIGDDWTIDLSGIWQRIDGEDSQYATRGGPSLSRRSGIAQPFSNDFLLGDVTIAREWDLLRFTLTGGIVSHRIDETYDATLQTRGAMIGWPTRFPLDSLPLPVGTAEDGIARAFDQSNRTRLLTAETRLSRAMDGGYGWLIGASVIRNRARITRQFGDLGAEMPRTGVRNLATELTAFGEVSVEPVTGVTFTGGARFNHVRLAGEGLDLQEASIEKLMAARMASTERNVSSFLPSVSVSVRPMTDIILYARYQEGFRPGGLAIRDDYIERYRNDEVATMETGVRYGAPGLTSIHASLAFAYTRWKNIQADLIDNQGLPATVNIGNGRIYSIDARIGWRVATGLQIDGALFFNDSEVTEPTLGLLASTSGSLPNVARVGARGAAEYRTSLGDNLDLKLSGSVRYVGKSRLGVGPRLDIAQGNYVDTQLFGRLGWERFGVSLTVSNLFDTVGNRFSLGSPFTYTREEQITPLRPRTVRLGMDMRF